jgi:hypothetical protein
MVSLLTVVNYLIATNPQFGPRRHESNSGQNKKNLQHKQKEVHDRLPVSAVMKTTNAVSRSLSNLKASALRSRRTTMIGATSDLFPLRYSRIGDLEVECTSLQSDWRSQRTCSSHKQFMTSMAAITRSTF